jgi:hypothetical protein
MQMDVAFVKEFEQSIYNNKMKLLITPKMKTNNLIKGLGKYISFFMLLILTSCSEEIEFNLNDSAPELVVAATVPESQFADVFLTTTISVNDKNEGNRITGALVTLEDENGNSELLQEIDPGHYRSSQIKGVQKTNYKLKIETDGQIKEITSEDRMPKPVSIHRLRVRESNMPDINGIPVPEWEVVVEYNDPADEKNYYRFVEYVNGEVRAHYVENDNFNNGTKNKSFLTSSSRKLVPGDNVTVEMQSISKAVYDYFYGFSLLNRITQGTAVVNPITNISGVKLGYFSAHTVSRKSIVIN